MVNYSSFIIHRLCLLCLCNFLFYLGKILNDETALKEYKIDEKNFVVVMVTKVSFCFILYILCM